MNVTTKLKFNSRISLLAVATLLVVIFFGCRTSNAQTTAQGNYTLLAPLPCIQTTDATGNTKGSVQCPPGNTQNVSTVTFQTYVQYAINLLIALAAVAAVFMIVWGGLEYMTTTSASGKGAGLERAKNAIYGLLLVLCSYLILRTIDPRLVAIPTTLVPKIKLSNLQTTSTAFRDLQSQADQYDETSRLQGAAMQQIQGHKIATQKELDDVNKKLGDIYDGVTTATPEQLNQLTADAARLRNQINNDDISLQLQIAKNGMNALLINAANSSAANVKDPIYTVKQINEDIDSIKKKKADGDARLSALGQYDTKDLSVYANYTDATLQLMKVNAIIQTAQDVYNIVGANKYTTIAKPDGSGYANEITIVSARSQLQAVIDSSTKELNNVTDSTLRADLLSKFQYTQNLMDTKWPPPR